MKISLDELTDRLQTEKRDAESLGHRSAARQLAVIQKNLGEFLPGMPIPQEVKKYLDENGFVLNFEIAEQPTVAVQLAVDVIQTPAEASSQAAPSAAETPQTQEEVAPVAPPVPAPISPAHAATQTTLPMGDPQSQQKVAVLWRDFDTTTDNQRREQIIREIEKLDPENDRLPEARQFVTRARSDAEASRQRSSYLSKLAERDDYKAISNVIQFIESNGWYADDDEMLRALEDAKAYRDLERSKHNELTTKMRQSDLQSRANAVIDLTNKVQLNPNQTIYDESRGMDVPILDMLQEAKANWKSASEENAQAALTRFKEGEVNNLSGTIERVKEELNKPYLDTEIQKFKDYLSDLEGKLAKYEKASESLVGVGSKAPFDQLVGYLGALSIYEGYDKWTSEVVRLDPIVTQILLDAVADTRRQSEQLYQLQKYDDALANLAKVKSILNRWPLPTTPPGFGEAISSAEKLSAEIDQKNTVFKEYMQEAQKIRAGLVEPNERNQALQGLGRLEANPRYQEFSDLADLQREAARYREIGDQYQSAKTNFDNKQYSTAYEISNQALNGGRAGQYGDQLNKIVTSSWVELKLQELQELVDRAKYIEARMLLAEVRAYCNEKRPLLLGSEYIRTRINDHDSHLTTIERDSKESKGLLDQAVKGLGLDGNPQLKLYIDPKCAAILEQYAKDTTKKTAYDGVLLELTRLVGGTKNPTDLAQKLEESLIHVMSGRPLAARLSAHNLLWHVAGFSAMSGWQMKDNDYKNIAAALAKLTKTSVLDKDMARLETQYSEKAAQTLSEEALRSNTILISSFRNHGFIDTQDRLEMAKYFEIAYGQIKSDRWENLGNWEDAFQIWVQLDKDYPGQVEIETSWRRTKIGYVGQQVSKLLFNDHDPDGAITILREAETHHQITGSFQVKRWLAEAYYQKKQYEHALGNLELAEKDARKDHAIEDKDAVISEITSQRERYQSERTYEELLAVATPVEHLSRADYLKKLVDGLAEGMIIEPERGHLLKLIDKKMSSYTKKLLADAEAEFNKGGQEDQVKGLEIISQLAELEKITKVPEEQRVAEGKIQQYSASVTTAINNLIYQVDSLDTNKHKLVDSERTYQTYQERLNTFFAVVKDLKLDEEGFIQKIEKARAYLSTQLEKLREAKTVLENGTKPDLLDKCIKNNEFSDADVIVMNLMNSGFKTPEILLFIEELSKVKAARNTFDVLTTKMKDLIKNDSFKEAVDVINQILLDETPEAKRVKRIMADEIKGYFLTAHKPMLIISGLSEIKDHCDLANKNVYSYYDWATDVDSKLHFLREGFEKADKIEKELEGLAKIERSALERYANRRSLTERLRTWQDIDEKCATLLNILYGSTDNTTKIGLWEQGEYVEALSNKANIYVTDTSKKVQDLDTIVATVKSYIRTLTDQLTISKFPAREELVAAQNQGNVGYLKTLLDRAQLVGPANDKETELLEFFSGVLDKFLNQKERPWYMWFLDLFRR